MEVGPGSWVAITFATCSGGIRVLPFTAKLVICGKTLLWNTNTSLHFPFLPVITLASTFSNRPNLYRTASVISAEIFSHRPFSLQGTCFIVGMESGKQDCMFNEMGFKVGTEGIDAYVCALSSVCVNM